MRAHKPLLLGWKGVGAFETQSHCVALAYVHQRMQTDGVYSVWKYNSAWSVFLISKLYHEILEFNRN